MKCRQTQRMIEKGCDESSERVQKIQRNDVESEEEEARKSWKRERERQRGKKRERARRDKETVDTDNKENGPI